MEDIKSVIFEVCNESVSITAADLIGNFGIRETSVGALRQDSVKINNENACAGTGAMVLQQDSSDALPARIPPTISATPTGNPTMAPTTHKPTTMRKPSSKRKEYLRE